MKKQQWLSHPSWWKSCDFPPLRNQMCTVKGSVSRDVIPLFFSWFEPIWATDKQAKVFSNYCSISPRYSITKLCAAHCGGKFFLHKKEKNTRLSNSLYPFFPPSPLLKDHHPGIHERIQYTLTLSWCQSSQWTSSFRGPPSPPSPSFTCTGVKLAPQSGVWNFISLINIPIRQNIFLIDKNEEEKIVVPQ